MAREYINREDMLNTGREKLNRSIDKSYDAEETSAKALEDANVLGNQAISDANKLGNEAKQISTEKGNESIAIAKENEKVASEANLIAKDTNERMNQIISSTTDSAEIIDSRKPLNESAYPTLGERLNNMPSNNIINNSKSDLILNFLKMDNEDKFKVREVFLQELEFFKALINKKYINLVFQTDHHYEERNNKSEDLKLSFSHMINTSLISEDVECVVFGGDTFDNAGTWSELVYPAKLKKQMISFMSAAFFMMKSDFFILNGNHEEATAKMVWQDTPHEEKIISDLNLINNLDVKKIFKTDAYFYKENRKNDSLYGYKDYQKNNSKVRVVWLDAFDTPYIENNLGEYAYPRIKYGGFRQEQLEWLVSEALNVEPDVHVIIFSHSPLNNTSSYFSDSFFNHSQVQKILEDFREKNKSIVSSEQKDFELNLSYDFSKNGGNLIAFVAGHTHKDNKNTINGVNYIETTCSNNVMDNMYKNRVNETNTLNEEAFDLIEIDTLNRKANFKRFGIGEDRSVNY